MSKSSAAEHIQRVNMAGHWLRQNTPPTEVLSALRKRYGVSRRQAYRYLHRAQQAAAPLPVPEAKGVFTVKLPGKLMTRIRRWSRRHRQPIGAAVALALQDFLNKGGDHG